MPAAAPYNERRRGRPTSTTLHFATIPSSLPFTYLLQSTQTRTHKNPWRRCCGRTNVKGSAKTTSFDLVRLGTNKKNCATTPTTTAAVAAQGADKNTGGNNFTHASSLAATHHTLSPGKSNTREDLRPFTVAAHATATAAVVTAAAAMYPRTIFSPGAGAGNALKQIIFSGGGGRHRLVLELDSGKVEPEKELEQRDLWFEVSFERSTGTRGTSGRGERVLRL